MKDLKTREDIILLIDTFYDTVKLDSTIGYIFTDVANVNWEKHLPTMYDFWETTLLGGGNYKGNPMAVHQKINTQEKLTPAHFAQWEKLFHATVNQLFSGHGAEMAKQRATSIKTVMQLKVCY